MTKLYTELISHSGMYDKPKLPKLILRLNIVAVAMHPGKDCTDVRCLLQVVLCVSFD